MKYFLGRKIMGKRNSTLKGTHLANPVRAFISSTKSLQESFSHQDENWTRWNKGKRFLLFAKRKVFAALLRQMKENAENAHIQTVNEIQNRNLLTDAQNEKFLSGFPWKKARKGHEGRCVSTYLEELGDCRINHHEGTMNQVNDSISHGNISHHDLGQHNAGRVLGIANDCVRLDVHCEEER